MTSSTLQAPQYFSDNESPYTARPSATGSADFGYPPSQSALGRQDYYDQASHYPMPTGPNQVLVGQTYQNRSSLTTQPEQPEAFAGRVASPRIDQARYWVGAMLTAVMAALIAVIAMVVASGILHIHVLMPSDGGLSAVSAAAYGLVTVGIALVAALVYLGMLHVAPRPGLYFGWLVGLISVLTALIPFTMAAPLGSQVTLAGMNLLVGITVMTLIPVAGGSARIRS